MMLLQINFLLFFFADRENHFILEYLYSVLLRFLNADAFEILHGLMAS